jgi:hypothetical protein
MAGNESGVGSANVDLTSGLVRGSDGGAIEDLLERQNSRANNPKYEATGMSEKRGGKAMARPKAMPAVRKQAVLTDIRPAFDIGICCSIAREQSMHMKKQAKMRGVPAPFTKSRMFEGFRLPLWSRARKVPLIPPIAMNKV